MIANSIQHLWAKILVEQLKKNNITTICIAPGSRSTCLVKAISEESCFNIMTHYDERSLAFFALGVAKASMKPTVVITTSGSAITNLIPASVEALNLQLPLLFITADRPAELQNCGANQTLDQSALFKPACRYQVNIDAPVEDESKLILFFHAIQDAISFSFQGPVHINMSFREPFFDTAKSYTKIVKKLAGLEKDSIRNVQKSCDLTHIFEAFKLNKTVCIIANLRSQIHVDYIVSWAEKNKIPIIAECTSKIRYSSHKAIGYVDDIITQMFEKNLLPDSLICIGSRWISKEIHKLILKVNKGVFLHDFSSTQDWLHSNLHEVLNYDLHAKNSLPNVKMDTDYYKKISSLNVAEKSIKTRKLTLKKCFYLLASKLSNYKSIFVGNSLAIREFNESFNSNNHQLSVFTQRGVSGIDGLVSTGAGISFSQKQKVAIIIGDTSCLYDTNGLFFLSKPNVNVDIFVLNNNGGKIFEKLPIKNDPILNEFFVMPHNLSFKKISDQFEIGYQLINSIDQLTKFESILNKKSRLIEIKLAN